MGRILDALTEFFRADGWNFSQLEGRTTLIMTVNGARSSATLPCPPMITIFAMAPRCHVSACRAPGRPGADPRGAPRAGAHLA